VIGVAAAVRPATPAPVHGGDLVRALRRQPHAFSIGKIADRLGVSPYYVRSQLYPRDFDVAAFGGRPRRGR
jgi:hypothetical protein